MSQLAEIITYKDALHREQLIKLWTDVFGYEADHNEPMRVFGGGPHQHGEANQSFLMVLTEYGLFDFMPIKYGILSVSKLSTCWRIA